MNNAGQPQTQGLTPQQQQQLAHFIRVEQIAGLRHITDAQKKKYVDGLRPLWDNIINHAPNEAEYQLAFRRLREVTQNLREGAQKFIEASSEGMSQASGGQQPVQRPQNQGPQAQQERPTTAQPQNSQQVNPAMPQVNQKLRFTLPPNLLPGSPEAEKWLNEAKTKYLQAYNKIQEAKKTITNIQAAFTQRQSAGKPLSAEETQQMNFRGTQAKKVYTDSTAFLERFKAQQQEFISKNQQTQQQSTSQGVPQQNVNPAMSRGPQQSSGGAPPQPNQISQTPSNVGATPQLPNPSLEPTRNQAHTTGNTSMSPSNSGQHHIGQSLPDQQQSAQDTTSQAQNTAPSHPPTNRIPQQPHQINTGTGVAQNPQHQFQQHSNSQRNSPQTAQPHSASQQLPPQPLSHSAAIAQAQQSYANSFPQNNPQATNMQPPHPNGDRTNNNTKMPIPKNLAVAQPSPVNMGPARPTLSGGPSNGAGGMMGQPAIQKHPQYVLEGEGDRVLSKKKLDELVRQVTGGGEGLGGEGLTAEVEEVSQIVSSLA